MLAINFRHNLNYWLKKQLQNILHRIVGAPVTHVCDGCARYRLNNAQLLELTRKAAPILGLNRDVFVSDTHYPQPLPDRCPYPARVVCNPYAVHRTYDGSCNNRRYPLWGSSNKPLSRLLPAQYADGKAEEIPKCGKKNSRWFQISSVQMKGGGSAPVTQNMIDN